ncbi:SAM-dependent methyltransferase [Halalkaliarchaeum desulfuricum]|uniref:SAM-dependent methyltransferase n=1 Tax=Halalkaliarchaeum desulfuricum TaxID=2055893 RepID=A0A343TMP2_9EURY|nr:class I SAM-dependent methyltransferase [Halalkaliarchaeum desulfuricum]AUX10364.1 SAM-dependent methyltransferase [Halalkaliarchaeum desulfuricum]
MTDPDLARRIADQFSGRGKRADIWRGFDAFLDTDAFLNLGYSPRYGSHLLGSPQDRLAKLVVAELNRHHRPSTAEDGFPARSAGKLLDVGCGRGGPTYRLGERTPFDVVGIDLVTENVVRAQDGAESSQRRGSDTGLPSFLVGDATRLPFTTGAFSAIVAVDSLVYVPAIGRALDEFSRVLADGGVGVVSDLVADRNAGVPDDDLERFGEAWDMPRPRPRERYLSTMAERGLRVRRVRDLTDNSVGRFRKWSQLYLAVADGPGGGVLERLLRREGLDPDAVTEQVRAAHRALPALRHVLVTFER